MRKLFICVDFARAELLQAAELIAKGDHQACAVCREAPPSVFDVAYKSQEPVARTKQKFPRPPKFLRKGAR